MNCWFVRGYVEQVFPSYGLSAPGCDYGAMEVRNAAVADLDRVSELMGQLGHPLPDRDAAQLWAVAVTDPAHDLRVAVADGVVVAMIDVVTRLQLHHGGLVATVDSLVVDSSLRGDGIGARLLEHAVERATARGGVRLIEVTSSSARTGAHQFYERQHFEKNGIRLVRSISSA